MSHYLLRQDRKRLKKKIAYMERAHEFALGEAHAETAEALHALARARYDRPVAWRGVSWDVALERQVKTFPHIALRMFAYREVIQTGPFHPSMRDQMRARVERMAADRIARGLIREGMVAVDRAVVPLRGQPGVEEYDWAVYVGLPVKKDPNA